MILYKLSKRKTAGLKNQLAILNLAKINLIKTPPPKL